ncbi:MAG: hypothetical protein CL609_07315 [Anaerolineaceae bacterium]|nr:hypothetical protein [Anaerolineaceae bacterium]
MINNLLETKFYIPAWRTNGIPRTELITKLMSGLVENRKLTLISAPAGYGKTTIAIELINSLTNIDQFPSQFKTVGKSKICWLSLESSDNDPARFLNFLILATQKINSTIGERAKSLLGMPQIPPIPEILSEFINDLLNLTDRLIFIFDDYHLIQNPQIHEIIENLINHMPLGIHLILTTRSDPPLPLARLRVRSLLTEIRAKDLSFDQRETKHFLNHAMQLNLEDEMISVLEKRTEGWAAGLQLAGLALQSNPNPLLFIKKFSGSHRYVIDYLVEEVLRIQTPEIQDFLNRTALLKRFNMELCQVISHNPNTPKILQHIERANLFLVPLDDYREWYRYHHLFSEVLKAGLSPQDASKVHTQAAQWFEEKGLLSDAIYHYLEIQDVANASRLMGLLAIDLLKNGEVQILLNWLITLPENNLREDPDLASYYALSLLLTGQIDQAVNFAKQTFQNFQGPSNLSASGRLNAIQAWFGLTTGNSKTKSFALSALDQLNEEEWFFRVIAMISLGSAYAWDTQLPESSQIFRTAYQIGRDKKNGFLSLGALANLVFNLIEMGQLREAETLCRTALREYVDHQGNDLPILGIIYSPLSSICFEKGDYEEAEFFAAEGIKLSKRLFSHIILGGDAEIILANIAFDQGKPDQAFELLKETAEIARQKNAMMVTFKMAFSHTQLYLWSMKLIEAKQNLSELESLIPSNLPKAEQVLQHLHARYLVAAEQPQQAIDILINLEQEDLKEGCHRRLMGVYMTQAIAYQKLNKNLQAMTAFEKLLNLAIPEGYRSVFYPKKGRQLQSLLTASRSVAPDFIDGILSLYSETQENQNAFNIQLIAPLSDQEINVLKLIVDGKSNQDIADELYISVGTAKWHVHNILQKLGVKNRSQAIVRAHELGIK